MKGLKPIIKRALPAPLESAYTRLRTRQIQRQYQRLGRAQAFERIYASAAWGCGPPGGAACSGAGSTGRHVREYGALLEGLLRSHAVRSIADLGCGDFSVGRAVAGMVSQYTGVDVAPSVIRCNTAAHSSVRVRFVCADLACDPLPAADAAVVRQVLQHLSNSEIRAALDNILRSYPLVFITEHVYTGPRLKPNLDMPHGPGTRVPFRSGVFVDLPPFNLRAEPAGDIHHAPREALRTWVVRGSSWRGERGMGLE